MKSLFRALILLILFAPIFAGASEKNTSTFSETLQKAEQGDAKAQL